MKKILVVDDQPQVRELVEVTLNNDDYQILMAENGPEAIKQTKTHKPDLILLDVMMPTGNMDGYEVCKMLKQDSETKDIIIIMLTAKSQKIDIEKGKQAGANDYFVKPFSPLELLSKIEKMLGD